MKIRVVFMGTPLYATEIFKELLKDMDFEVCALFTQPDKKAGRGQILTPPHIKIFLQENKINLPVFQPDSLKDETIQKLIINLKPDFIVVAAYGKILPQNILDIAPCINLHASLLPKYRGASPIQYSILNSDKYSGVTAMKMKLGLDTGDILGFSYVCIENMSFLQLFNKLSEIAAKLTIKILKNYNNLSHVKQINALSSYASKISKEDGLIDFSFSCNDFKQKLLALNPWPGLYINSGLKLKEFFCEEKKVDKEVGTITQIDDKEVRVVCQNGELVLQRVCPPSKQEMDASSYVRGKRVQIGDKIF